MLADALLLLAGTLSGGTLVPFSFVTNPTTAGTPLLMPYLLTNPTQNASGSKNNYGVDLGAGRPLYLRGCFMNDANGAAVNNLAGITDFKVDVFLTSSSTVAAFTASSTSQLILDTLHLNDGVNYVRNYASGQDFYLPLSSMSAYHGTADGVGPNYLGAMVTTVGAAFTAGALVLELVAADSVTKGHSYASGFVAL